MKGTETRGGKILKIGGGMGWTEWPHWIQEHTDTHHARGLHVILSLPARKPYTRSHIQ